MIAAKKRKKRKRDLLIILFVNFAPFCGYYFFL